MLSDSLSKSIKKMKQLDIVENAALDAEKKAKNDSDYSTIVMDFSSSMSKLQKATQLMDYSITSEKCDIVRCCRCRFFERCMSAYKQKGKCESYEGMEIIPSEEDGRKHFEDQYIGEFGIRFGKRIKNQNQYSQWK